jgi:FkbM family methyltransferase
MAASVVRGLHPRSIAWQIKHAAGPVHPIVTRIGWHGDLKVRIHSRDVLGKHIYQYRIFEASEARLVTRFLKSGMIFIDVGANFGQYTLLAAERVGPGGQVHSFEPSARMYAELNYNVRLNDLQERCVLNNMALSDRQGISRLSKYEEGAEVYGSLGTQHWVDAPIVGFEEVATTTLDTYLTQCKIRHVDLIKMDIEGAELLALRGGAGLLCRADAPAIVLEMADINTDGFGYTALDTWDYLESLQYRFYSFANRRATLSKALRPNSFLPAQNLLAIKHGFHSWGITTKTE